MLNPAEHEKLWDMIKPLKYGMLTTIDQGRLRSRPMALTQDEFDGSIYFFTKDDTHKVEEINHDHEVGVSFASPEDQTFVSVSGDANLKRDKTLIDKFWDTSLKAYFPEGKDDPHLALMKIDVKECEFWDSDKGKMSRLFEMARAVSQGERADMGQHGRM